METLEGTVEEILYRNELNGYTVATVAPPGSEVTTLVGCMPFLNIGEILKAYGTWVEHPDYGHQFKVERYEKIMPSSLDAVEKYIASGLVKGIGPSTAAKIVERFGKSTLSVIYDEPVKLAEIKGISIEKAIELGGIFREQRALAEIIIFLQQYGIGSNHSVKIYREYGEETKEVILNNPYILLDLNLGLTFKTVDLMASRMEIPVDAQHRVESGIMYTLLQAVGNGHTFVPEDKLAEYTANLLGLDRRHIIDSVASLSVKGAIYADRTKTPANVYLYAYHAAETYVAQRLASIAATFGNRGAADTELPEIEGLPLSETQLDAVRDSMVYGAVIITGGPGTGKTTIIKAIISAMRLRGLEVALAAPTGRAAKRMTETSGFEAKTVHRLLGVAFEDTIDEPAFEFNEHNPLDADVVIIDEISMVDIMLMKHLLKAIGHGTRLIMVGDADQLPSVGPGNVLRDLIASGRIHTVKLTEIFRQAAESNIIVNAHRINRGEFPLLNEKDKDFFFMQKEDTEQGVDTILELCIRRLPATYGFDPSKHIQVLTPTKKGPAGVYNLNMRLQEVLNPPDKNKKEKHAHGYIFREGDRVMQTSNNYKLKWERDCGNDDIQDGTGVFNGDTGMIEMISDTGQYIRVRFDDEKYVDYTFDQLDDLDPAYALTIHKSQGSEFPVVILPVYPGPPVLMTRNLLYTAISRARDMVVIVGHKSVLADMVNNLKEDNRYSSLKERLAAAE